MTAGVQRMSPADLDRLVPGWREDVQRVVAEAPPLTEAQRTEIALLLRRTDPPGGSPPGQRSGRSPAGNRPDPISHTTTNADQAARRRAHREPPRGSLSTDEVAP